VWDEVREQAEVELGQLRTLLSYHASLLRATETREPDSTELAAIAGILHSFYNGIEKIFERIAKDIDHSPPSGSSSHSELLSAMAEDTGDRPPVISEALLRTLWRYKDFRHFYRHGYTFLLRWSKMADLVAACQATLDRVETEVQSFFSTHE